MSEQQKSEVIHPKMEDRIPALIGESESRILALQLLEQELARVFLHGSCTVAIWCSYSG